MAEEYAVSLAHSSSQPSGLLSFPPHPTSLFCLCPPPLQTSKKMLSDMGFLDSLRAYDKVGLPPTCTIAKFSYFRQLRAC